MLTRLLLPAALAILTLAGPAHAQQPRTVHVQVTENGYVPNEIVAEPGEHLLVIFENDGTAGCAQSVVVPSAKARGEAKPGQPFLVEVTVPRKGTVRFACSMNMYDGVIRLRAKDEPRAPADDQKPRTSDGSSPPPAGHPSKKK